MFKIYFSMGSWQVREYPQTQAFGGNVQQPNFVTVYSGATFEDAARYLAGLTGGEFCLNVESTRP